MENLLALFNKIQQVAPLPIFSQEIIVVQNKGMQHWLNLSVAQQRGIAMNFRYALPSQFLWKLVRSLVSAQQMPEQSPYAREVLVWRIDNLLQQTVVLEDPIFSGLTHYWQANSAQQAKLKRYQLAQQLADLFEQYLVFRPDWLHRWQQDRPLLEQISSEHGQQLQQWQGQLWRLLNAEIPYDPVSLLHTAKQQISQQPQLLPERIAFFGINSLAPIWLEFIAALSEQIEVHFFHLNPCFDYWGDILSEKQAAKRHLTQWSDLADTEQPIGNPLLANLGQQGREFLNLLQQYSSINIELFEQAQVEYGEQLDTTNTTGQLSVLQQIQNDILQLSDARAAPKVQIDQSITITSAHSALREVQGLHDWLLDQFNQDGQLTPKDVLVMCPQVEHYAPYVEAVFAQGWRELNANVPPLPCSIADRISKDADPIIAAFLELLSLPDSRFQVSQIMSFLRLPSIQLKFALTYDDLELISDWLANVAIHWGLDEQHKQHLVASEQANANFTWQQGISRLLLGFAYGEQPIIYQQQLLCPMVEAGDAELLGKFLLILEQLQQYSQSLSRPRSCIQWQQFLLQLLADLFADQGEAAFLQITQAIGALVEYQQQANYQQLVSLVVVKEFLTQHFSEPDPGRQFLVGQVTFCSLLPMRSIPFKVIAILGLNDGEFPRQRTELGFDLMPLVGTRIGDRSRRGDDRYLFLEALICARKALYLSYQGRSIRNNAKLQPSIVLQELMSYLTLGYSWDFTEAKQLRQLPMQPFSEQNYTADKPSFDANWLALQQQQMVAQQHLILTETQAGEQVLALSCEQLLRFYQHPAKVFAERQLSLFLRPNTQPLEDVEPFASDGLAVYLLKQALVTAQLASPSTVEQDVIERAKLSGQFPDSPLMANQYQTWQQQSQQFAEQLLSRGFAQPTTVHCEFTLALTEPDQHLVLSGQLPICQQQLVFYRSSGAKAKDLLNLYLHHLLLMVWQQQQAKLANKATTECSILLTSVTHSTGLFLDSKNNKIKEYQFVEIAEPEQQLATLIRIWRKGQQQALLLNAELGQLCAGGQSFAQTEFEQFWQAAAFQTERAAFGDDAYIRYFWPECPELVEHLPLLTTVYQPLFDALREVN